MIRIITIKLILLNSNLNLWIEIMNNTNKNFPIIFVLYAYFILFCN